MNQFNFDRVRRNIRQQERAMMVTLSNQAQNYFVDSFRKEGFDGQKWKEVQRRTAGTSAFKYPKKKGLQRQTAKILIGAGYKSRGGTLRRAVSNMARTAQISGLRTRMIVDLPYAMAHNEGTKTAGRKRSTNIPKRQFIGQTIELTSMQRETIKRIIDNTWRT